MLVESLLVGLHEEESVGVGYQDEKYLILEELERSGKEVNDFLEQIETQRAAAVQKKAKRQRQLSHVWQTIVSSHKILLR